MSSDTKIELIFALSGRSQFTEDEAWAQVKQDTSVFGSLALLEGLLSFTHGDDVFEADDFLAYFCTSLVRDILPALESDGEVRLKSRTDDLDLDFARAGDVVTLSNEDEEPVDFPADAFKAAVLDFAERFTSLCAAIWPDDPQVVYLKELLAGDAPSGA